MPADKTPLETTNTVVAVFDRPERADEAARELGAIGVTDCRRTEEPGRSVLTVDARAREDEVRRIVRELGGREQDLPG